MKKKRVSDITKKSMRMEGTTKMKQEDDQISHKKTIIIDFLNNL